MTSLNQEVQCNVMLDHMLLQGDRVKPVSGKMCA